MNIHRIILKDLHLTHKAVICNYLNVHRPATKEAIKEAIKVAKIVLMVFKR